jgi:hypothetical protein
MVDITVFPFFAYLSNSLTIESALKLSSPDVGSSKRMREGFVINSTPIEVRFLSPPEMVFCITEPIIVSAEAVIPNSERSSSTL